MRDILAKDRHRAKIVCLKTLLKNSSKGTLNIDSVCVKIRLIMTLEKRLKETTAKLARPGEPKEIHFLTESKTYSDLG